MPAGNKSAYTEKQKRQAEHIAEGYKRRGRAPARAEEIAWRTVNKQDGGGKKSGSARQSAKSTKRRPAARRRAGSTKK